MIEVVLPRLVAAADAYGDEADASPFAEERRIVERAVETRRREFATGRACARRALGVFGVAPAPIGRTASGAPCWPAGFAGSITHCSGYRAAAVAPVALVAAIGIDAEPNEPLPDGVLDKVASAAEVQHLPRGGTTCWARLLFSAKECVYKVWHPLQGTWLGFEDAAVTIDAARGTFTVRVEPQDGTEPPARLRTLEGRFHVEDRLLITAIALLATADGAGVG